MFVLENLIRHNIRSLEPYSSARNEYTGQASIFLDANENPYNTGFNRYPDPLQTEVKTLLARHKGVSPSQIFLGNGSDEAIDLVYRIFCRPGIDNVVAPAPTYGMYQVCAEINDIAYRAVPLTDDYQLDMPAMQAALDANTRVVWLCSPNNPCGNLLRAADVKWFLEHFDGIVVIDEAYIDFASEASKTEWLSDYPGLIILQTFSKAWGQAAIRLGIAMASPAIIDYFNKVKYPYNVNELTQRHALNVLQQPEVMLDAVSEILAQRDFLARTFAALPVVQTVYPSDANFLLVQVADANALYAYLQQEGIIVRNRHRVLKCGNCLRITVGTPSENRQLIDVIERFAQSVNTAPQASRQ